MSSQSIKLTEAELEKSFKVLKSQGCSDFLPQVFETEAIEYSWTKVVEVLMKIDLLNYKPQPAQKLVAPRQRYTTRVIKLLDPLDTLLITGLILRIIPDLNTAYASLNKKCVFSCNYDLSLSDSFFNFKQDYLLFRKELDGLLGKYQFVASADINDFYPRLYLHRLENALDNILGKGKLETRCLMRFVESWAEGTSYGIPVGPHFTHVLGEITLHEVDSFLLSRKIKYIRFIDDYYLFGDSEAQCLHALYLLGDRLQSTQGLSLNSAKTRVWRSETMSEKLNFEDRPDAKLRKEIIDKVFGGNPYVQVDYDDLSQMQKDLLAKCDIKKGMRHALGEESLTDFSSIKFILQVLTALSKPELTDIVLDNLSKLYPVAPSVARFLNVFDQIDSTERSKIGTRIIEFLCDDDYVPDFQSIWLLTPFIHSKAWNNLLELRNIAESHSNRLVKRQAILAIGESEDRSAILDVKVRMNDAIDWEQRAIVYACRNLPGDEKDAFLRTLKKENDWKIDDLLMRCVVEYIL